jgi:hypothetical protein
MTSLDSKIKLEATSSLGKGISSPSSTKVVQQGLQKERGLPRAALLSDMDLPFCRMFYPLGSAEIVTNHAAVLDAAEALHAAFVSREGEAFCLCGDSGSGKSSLSYACARAGWVYTF